MPWLDDLLTATDEAETPKSYIWWAGLAAISAVIKNQVFLQKGSLYALQPNIYVLIVGDSGMRKSFATNLCKKLVAKTNNTRVISGRSSIQSVIEQLSTSQTHEDTTPIFKDSAGLLHSNEFGVFLVEDPQCFKILTNLYDSHYEGDGWKNTLKSGVATLKDISLTLIGAMTPSDFKEHIPKGAVTGGFIARCLIVLEDKLAKINPLTEDDTSKAIDIEKLSKRLLEIKDLKGAFHWTPDARKIFEDWYAPYMKNIHKLEDKTGFCGRLNDHVLKVAMLISLSKDNSLLIREDDISEALEKCLGLSGLNRVTAGIGLSDYGGKIAKFLDALLKSDSYRMSRVDLLKRFYGDFNAGELDIIVDTLEQAKAITKVKAGTQMYYKLTEASIKTAKGEK